MARPLINVNAYMDGLDVSGVSNSVDIPVTAEAPESTVFNSEWRTREEGGLKMTAFSLEGYYDAEATDTEQFEALGDKATITVMPDGIEYGDVGYIVPSSVVAYTPSGSVGELMAFTFAGEGDGIAHRAQVLDVRAGVTAAATTTRRQLGAVPSGDTLHLWVNVERNAGTIEIDLVSSPTMAGAVAARAKRSSIVGRGLYALTVDGPITDEFWELVYTPTGASPDFDVAAATFFAAQNVVQVPITRRSRLRCPAP